MPKNLVVHDPLTTLSGDLKLGGEFTPRASAQHHSRLRYAKSQRSSRVLNTSTEAGAKWAVVEWGRKQADLFESHYTNLRDGEGNAHVISASQSSGRRFTSSLNSPFHEALKTSLT